MIGYPRTRLQAIALQKARIVPDRFFILKTSESMIHNKVLKKLEDNTKENPLTETEVENAIRNAVLEYNMYYF